MHVNAFVYLYESLNASQAYIITDAICVLSSLAFM